MKGQPAAFLRTALPLAIDMLPQLDSGRCHSIWLPDDALAVAGPDEERADRRAWSTRCAATRRCWRRRH